MEWVTEGAVIFLSHAFWHPLTTFGVLVIFLHTPGFRCFAAPPRATGCRPPGSIIPRTPCAKVKQFVVLLCRKSPANLKQAPISGQQWAAGYETMPLYENAPPRANHRRGELGASPKQLHGLEDNLEYVPYNRKDCYYLGGGVFVHNKNAAPTAPCRRSGRCRPAS